MKFIVHRSSFIVKCLSAISLLTITNYLLPVTYAAVDLSQDYAFGDVKSLGEGTSRLVVPTFSIAIVLVTFYFLFGAFKILTAGGDKEAIGAGRGMITHAIIGFVILMFAFLILQFLLSSLFGLSGFQIIKTT